MKSTKPYLLRAMHEWIVDSDSTPHVLARAEADGLEVPEQAIVDGRVVLNISPSAVRDLLIDDEGVSFVARFGGVSRSVYLPLSAVEGIYARENGRGMLFGDDQSDQEVADDARSVGPKKTGPSLKVIK